MYHVRCTRPGALSKRLLSPCSFYTTCTVALLAAQVLGGDCRDCLALYSNERLKKVHQRQLRGQAIPLIANQHFAAENCIMFAFERSHRL